MTTGSYTLGGQDNFIVCFGDRDNPESTWVYKYNFENDTGALALDQSLRTRRWQDGETTADTKTESESIVELEAMIDSHSRFINATLR